MTKSFGISITSLAFVVISASPANAWEISRQFEADGQFCMATEASPRANNGFVMVNVMVGDNGRSVITVGNTNWSISEGDRITGVELAPKDLNAVLAETLDQGFGFTADAAGVIILPLYAALEVRRDGQLIERIDLSGLRSSEWTNCIAQLRRLPVDPFSEK